MAFQQVNCTPERPNKNFVFSSLFPHPTDPIQKDTFNALDSVIQRIITDLDLENDSWYYPRSMGSEIIPEVSVLRRLGPDGLKCLGACLMDRETTTSYNFRNDAGTTDQRRQAAGSMRVIRNELHIQERWTDSVSETETVDLLGTIKARVDSGSFVRAKRVIYL